MFYLCYDFYNQFKMKVFYDKYQNKFMRVYEAIEQQSDSQVDCQLSNSSKDQVKSNFQLHLSNRSLAIGQLQWNTNGSPIRLSMDLKDQFDPLDNTLLWAINLPPPVPSTRPPLVVFPKSTIGFLAWPGNAGPVVIYFGVDGFQGYLDQNGNKTNRLVKYTKLDQVHDQSNNTNRVTYINQSDSVWYMPANATVFKLRVYLSSHQTALSLPLYNTICLQVQFHRIFSRFMDEN